MKFFANSITRHRHLATFTYSAGVVCLAIALALSLPGGVSQAAGLAATAPGLGEAAVYSVLGATSVTCTGGSTTTGSVGVSPGTSITGFPVPCIAGGGTHSNDASAIQAHADTGNADLALTAQGPGTPILPGLDTQNLGPGVYSTGSALLSGGVLTLNGAGVYIFLVASDLTTSGSVSLINGASACNVFWHVGSAAHINGGSFVGTIIAGTQVTFGDGASLDGRALAKTADVTLINNSISGPSCSGGGPTPVPGAPTATPVPPQPSYVDVSYPCSTNPSTVTVSVGLSAGVIVYGLGADITSGADTGANKIVRVLPFGHYAWHAVAPAGHYLVAVPDGVVDAFLCPASAPGATAVPGATVTPTASATGVPLLPLTGADLAGGRALAARHLMQGSLGLLGLSLVLLGVALWRKRE
jgi:hypothetical protein